MKKYLFIVILLWVTACQETTIAPETFGSLSGTVIDEDGQVVADALIATIPATSTVLTDSSGRFLLEAVPVAEYTVTAEKTSYLNEQATISVSQGQTAQVLLSLQKRDEPRGGLSGTVLDAVGNQPLRNTNITTRPPTKALLTDSAGMFTLDSLPQGDYTILMQKVGYRTDSVAVAIASEKITEVTKLLEPEQQSGFNRPVQPFPAIRAENLSDTVTLRWEVADWVGNDSLQFDVLLYSADEPAGDAVATQLSATELQLTDLMWNTTYFWQVITYNSLGNRTAGEVWSFTTQSFPAVRYLFSRIADENAEVYAADSSAQRIRRLTRHPGRDVYPRFSPNRETIAFVSDRSGNQQLHLMQSDGSNIQQISTLPIAGYHQDGQGYCWSPDGGQLLYVHYEKLYRIDRDGTGLTEIATAPSGYHFLAVDWTPVDDKVVVQVVSSDRNDTELYLMDADGSDQETLRASNGNQLGAPSFSINGTQVLFTEDVSGFVSPTGRQLDARIFTMDVATQAISEVSVNKPDGFNDLHPRFSPNGAQIVFEHTSNEENTSTNIQMMDADGQNRQRLFVEAKMPYH